MQLFQRLFYCGKGKLLYSYHRMFNQIKSYLQYYKVIRIVHLYKTGLLQLQITKISLEETTTTKTVLQSSMIYKLKLCKMSAVNKTVIKKMIDKQTHLQSNNLCKTIIQASF